jgi:hypothetical protein
MTCLLNNFGTIHNIKDIVNFLNNKNDYLTSISSNIDFNNLIEKQKSLKNNNENGFY